MALRDLVEDLAPRPATRWIGGVQGPAALELGTLALGKLDMALRQTIPEVLGRLDPLFGGQVTEIEDRGGHSRRLGLPRAKGKQGTGPRRIGAMPAACDSRLGSLRRPVPVARVP